ncbi:MAG: hypothetical protein KJN71_04805 [Acidimicrobiia bacterium]|nr:hypothetical protein [Acidimicrobiia bacterium]
MTVENVIARHFIARSNVMAVQGPRGAYFPARRQGVDRGFTKKDITRHVEGDVTLGHYLLDGDACKLFAFDIDIDKGWYGQWNCMQPGWPNDELHDLRSIMIAPSDHPLRGYLIKQLRSIADGLAWAIENKIGIKAAVSFSGSKGMHVYGLYGQKVLAREAIAQSHHLIGQYSSLVPQSKLQNWKSINVPGTTIEIFPKQDRVSEGSYGNLMRLPLGIHKKTGARSFFFDWKHEDATELREISIEEAVGIE